MDKQTIEHNGLFFEMITDEVTSRVEVPAGRVDSEIWENVGVAEIGYHFPNHNPEDYSYGLFTEK